MLCYARTLRNVSEICGVTRARNFGSLGKGKSYAEYCMEENGLGDSGLSLHTRAGAKLHSIVYNWRPTDTDNAGNGVYMSYNVRAKTKWHVA